MVGGDVVEAVAQKDPQDVCPAGLGIEKRGCLFGWLPGFHEVHALGDLWHAGFPVVLVLTMQWAGIALGVVFSKDIGDAALALTKGQVVSFHIAELVEVFHVAVKDASFEDLDAIDWVQSTADPVTDISAGT